MKKQEKIFLVENLAEELKAAKSAVLVNYTGLSVKDQETLKKALKGVGAKMLVVKNSLLRRAGAKAGVDENILKDEVLTGQTALIVGGDDPLAFIQVLGKFTKEHEVPKMKVGVVEGLFQDEEALKKIASLPSRDALLGQLLGVLSSPNSGLVGTLKGNLQKLVMVLKGKAG